jgi:hypothetical protein
VTIRYTVVRLTLKRFGDLVKRRLTALGPFAFAIDGNAVRAAEAGDMSSCPGASTSRLLARSIEDGGDCSIR